MDPTDSGTQQHGVRTYITCKNVESRLEGSSIYITDMPEVRYRYVALVCTLVDKHFVRCLRRDQENERETQTMKYIYHLSSP